MVEVEGPLTVRLGANALCVTIANGRVASAWRQASICSASRFNDVGVLAYLVAVDQAFEPERVVGNERPNVRPPGRPAALSSDVRHHRPPHARVRSYGAATESYGHRRPLFGFGVAGMRRRGCLSSWAACMCGLSPPSMRISNWPSKRSRRCARTSGSPKLTRQRGRPILAELD